MTGFSQEVPNFPLSFSETSQNNQSGKFGGFINKIHRGRQWCVWGGVHLISPPLGRSRVKIFCFSCKLEPLEGADGSGATEKKKR